MSITNSEFLAYGMILILVYSLKRYIVELLFDLFTIEINPAIITYICGILFAILAIIGIFFNDTPSSISTTFDELQPDTKDKPMKYFDVNTNGKEIFKY